jgi:DNA polymerase I-like protein with 3'-5' exonuclease and polymerase domains
LWYANRGYILNARGLPMAVPHKFKKDLMNRFIQSTGHCILQLWLLNIKKLSDERGYYLQPIIPDFHDAGIFMVREEDSMEAKKIMEDALKETNNVLGWSVPMTGKVSVGYNVKDVK